MGRESGQAGWGTLFKWALFLVCAGAAFAFYWSHREQVSAWLDKPLDEMVAEPEAEAPSGGGRDDGAAREAQQQEFAERKAEAEAARAERYANRAEGRAQEGLEDGSLLSAADAARLYIDERAVLKARGFDPWSDPDSCSCSHRYDIITRRNDTSGKVRSTYLCTMSPKPDAPPGRTSKEWTIEVDSGFSRDASGNWEYLGPKS